MRRFAVLTAAALTLAACATRPATEVTRFHLGAPIARSTIYLEPADARAATSLEFRTYADAVGRELTAQNFVPSTASDSAYTGTIAISEDYRPRPRGGGLTIGLGGGSFGRGGGVGGGVSFPVGRQRPDDIRVTTLNLQIKRRSDSSIVWEGRATGAGDAPPGEAVPALARALLSGFPGPAGQTVRVAEPRRPG